MLATSNNHGLLIGHFRNIDVFLFVLLILSMFGILKILMFFHLHSLSYLLVFGHWQITELHLGRAASILKSL